MNVSEPPLDPSNAPIQFSIITNTTTHGHPGGSGNRTTIWVAVDNRETAICVCAPSLHGFRDFWLPQSEIFYVAVSTALHHGWTGVYISSEENAVSSLDMIPIPSNPAPGLSIPDNIGLPTYNANTFAPRDAYRLRTRCVQVIELDGQLLVSKQISEDNIVALQEEFDNYLRAQNSPYILPLQGLIREQQLYVEPETMRVRSRERIVGFLLPFVGILSQWLLGGEWTVEEKEFLAITLLDGVLDLERRGVYLSDLKKGNILLTPAGLKIIDLSSTAYTPGYIDRRITEASPRWTPYGLGRAFAELFLERHPSYQGATFIPFSATTPIKEVIKRCCTNFSDEFQSVEDLWEATTSLLQPIRERAHSKRITIPRLCEARLNRIENDASSWEESHFGQTRVGNEELSIWLPEFARESARRWFVTPDYDEAELWSDRKPTTPDPYEPRDISMVKKPFHSICWGNYHCNQSGDHLMIYWVVPCREIAVCVCTPLDGYHARLPESDIFRLAVQAAVDGGFIGVFIAIDNTISQYDAFPDTPPRPLNIVSLRVPNDIDIPIWDEDDPQLLYHDILMFRDHDMQLVKLNDSYFVYKYTRGDLASLQEELDRYIQLRGSPHILNLQGLVRVTERHIDPKTFRVESWSRISGFLLPFTGAWSNWWIGGEWIIRNKEYLAVRLLEAVLAIEHSGVHLTELSKDNILLTSEGLKIISLSSCSRHSALSLDDTRLDPAARTVFALGKAFAELFLERHPSAGAHTYIAASTPPVFVNIIKRCCAIRTSPYRSVEDLYNDISDSLVEIRSRSMSITGLAFYRESFFGTQGATNDEMQFGQTNLGPYPQPWIPPSTVEKRRMYWEPPESHEAELWIDVYESDGQASNPEEIRD
ncbi:hypothetical protein Hypma_002798 [Hypsizygus marmoreus]|uniref:Protein kinase domain-containing protein n=1 Tax=Hypsizygus marmoreus TaxID=39966 RepID=A0A369J867_HYPMA|nr:hypothetical protein Hypma_002798 [Hypsizygus marmoreus]